VNTDKPIVITAVLPASSQHQNYFCVSIWSSSYYSLIGFDGSDGLFDLLLLMHFLPRDAAMLARSWES